MNRRFHITYIHTQTKIIMKISIHNTQINLNHFLYGKGCGPKNQRTNNTLFFYRNSLAF